MEPTPLPDLSHLRTRIDQLDAALVAIVAERLAVCREVAEVKQRVDAPVIQPARVRDVVTSRRKLAIEAGFDPDFVFSWPTGRMGVMEGDAAVAAVHGPALAAAKAAGAPPEASLQAAVDAMRADYDAELDARHAGARGHIDAIVYPEDTRTTLAMALRAAWQHPGSHLGPYVLPCRS